MATEDPLKIQTGPAGPGGSAADMKEEEVKSKPPKSKQDKLKICVAKIDRYASNSIKQEFPFIAASVLARGRQERAVPDLEGKPISDIFDLFDDKFKDNAASVFRDALEITGYGADGNDSERLADLDRFCEDDYEQKEILRGKMQFRKDLLARGAGLIRCLAAGAFKEQDLGVSRDRITTPTQLAQCLIHTKFISEKTPQESLENIDNLVKEYSISTYGTTLTVSGSSGHTVRGGRQEAVQVRPVSCHKRARIITIVCSSLALVACVSLVLWLALSGSTASSFDFSLYSNTAIQITTAPIDNLYISQLHVDILMYSDEATSQLCAVDCTYHHPRTKPLPWNVSNVLSINSCSEPIIATMRADVRIELRDATEYLSPYLLTDSYAQITTNTQAEFYIYDNISTCKYKSINADDALITLALNSSNSFSANFSIPPRATEGGSYYCGLIVLPVDNCTSSLSYSFVGEIMAYDIEHYRDNNMCQDPFEDPDVFLSYAAKKTCVLLTQELNGGFVETSTKIAPREGNPSLVSISSIGVLVLLLTMLVVAVVTGLYLRQRTLDRQRRHYQRVENG